MGYSNSEYKTDLPKLCSP